MAGLGQSMTGQKALTAVERERQALELRKAGVGFEQIASQLGYHQAAGAYKAVKRAMLKTIQEPADDVRALDLARLDVMLFAIWGAVRRGDMAAIDRALKIMTRRASLLGLDAPAKINVTHLVQQAAEQFGLTETEAAELHADVQEWIASEKAATS